MKEGYIPQSERKKILFLCDDIRMHSGIATMAREIVIGTAHRYNWFNVGAAIKHPEQGKIIDVAEDTNAHAGITDSNVKILPIDGYGTADLIRQLITAEKPDAIFFFTDPRYWIWLFQVENEFRKQLPFIYLNIWDDLPAPLYNEPYYESCDALLAISKQTENINRLVLGDKAKDKVVAYVPHGINEKIFFPVDTNHSEYSKLQEIKKSLFGDKEYEYIVFYNARNIRRKCTSDLIAAYQTFVEGLTDEQAAKCALVLHTQPIDEHGTDLVAVKDLICTEKANVMFSNNRISSQELNLLYNLSEVCVLPSSNEGWGLSLTESMMAGKMIIANVTGGMQDQMRFEDEKGEWIKFDENFCSNHFGTYKKCGEWAIPVFPSNRSLVGSPPTPYIWDDRVDFRDLANALRECFDLNKEERARRGMSGHTWATSDESMMSARWMSNNIIKYIDQTLATWKPRKSFELIKVEKYPVKKLRHKLVY
jgi:glycosyltransferase involved in cell wall biosynthesis